ncbi:hypothetical protein BKA62DRAFT_715696 [Auriculariales sp. MPI-PUGE-AT-0066]|nr:hypothetical protein BKA62DRAFT_715696 [Auriculariales sp. MPI-PUGE-AT-0066]
MAIPTERLAVENAALLPRPAEAFCPEDSLCAKEDSLKQDGPDSGNKAACDLMPNELLVECLHYCDMPDRISAGQVSRSWRDASLTPLLWSRVVVLPQSCGKVEHYEQWLAAALAKSQALPLDITFRTSVYGDGIMRLLAEHMHRVRTLVIEPDTPSGFMVPLLERRASSVRIFSFRFMLMKIRDLTPEDIIHISPKTLPGAEATLETLEIGYFTLPPAAPTRVFPRVVRFAGALRGSATNSNALFSHFPNLRSLKLALPDGCPLPPAPWPTTLRTLELLTPRHYAYFDDLLNRVKTPLQELVIKRVYNIDVPFVLFKTAVPGPWSLSVKRYAWNPQSDSWLWNPPAVVTLFSHEDPATRYTLHAYDRWTENFQRSGSGYDFARDTTLTSLHLTLHAFQLMTNHALIFPSLSSFALLMDTVNGIRFADRDVNFAYPVRAKNLQQVIIRYKASFIPSVMHYLPRMLAFDRDRLARLDLVARPFRNETVRWYDFSPLWPCTDALFVSSEWPDCTQYPWTFVDTIQLERPIPP